MGKTEKNAENGRTNRDQIKDVEGTYLETFCSMSSMCFKFNLLGFSVAVEPEYGYGL